MHRLHVQTIELLLNFLIAQRLRHLFLGEIKRLRHLIKFFANVRPDAHF